MISLAQVKTEGAPSFAQFAKGGNHERIRNRVCGRAKVVSAASLHPRFLRFLRSEFSAVGFRPAAGNGIYRTGALFAENPPFEFLDDFVA